MKKLLHVGNILNNAYLNAKFLRRAGFESDVLTVDYRHVQAQPEWEEVAIVDPKLDPYNPDWSRVDLGAFRRPDWFYDLSLSELTTFTPETSGCSPIHSRINRVRLATMSHHIRHGLHPYLSRIGVIKLKNRLKERRLLEEMKGSANRPLWDRLMKEYASYFPKRSQSLSLRDILLFREYAEAHSHLLGQYKLIQAYGIDPIQIILSGCSRPFIAFEHGTLRDFPFEDSARGRLYALAVKMAEKVIITNADVIRSAQKLGLDNIQFVPHPVDEKLYRRKKSLFREKILEEKKVDWIFLAPARHHWKNCPPGMETSWLKCNDVLIRGLAELKNNKPHFKFSVIFFEWGQEVDLSKQLLRDLNLTENSIWVPICSKQVMVDYYNAADIVFDQFNDGIGTFGTVVPESLACGKPVVLNYKEHLHRWCYEETPPLLNCTSAGEIASKLGNLLEDPYQIKEIGEKGYEWFQRYHSSEVITSRLLSIYREISEKYNWKWEV